MFVYIVKETYGDGYTYSGEVVVEIYDSFEKASGHLFNLIDDNTFAYDMNDQGKVIELIPRMDNEQTFYVETKEVK